MFTALMLTLAATVLGPLVGPIGPKTDHVQDSVDAWHKVVKTVIEDEQKETEAIALVDKVDEELKARRAVISEAMNQYLKVDSTYSSTPEDYETAIIALNKIWNEQETWLIGNLVELKGLMTDAEWKEAIEIVDEKMKEQWDTVKETQTLLRNNYLKKQKKVEKDAEEEKKDAAEDAAEGHADNDGDDDND